MSPCTGGRARRVAGSSAGEAAVGGLSHLLRPPRRGQEGFVVMYKVWVDQSVYEVEALNAEDALTQKTAFGEEGYVFAWEEGDWFGMRGSRGHKGVAWASGRYELRNGVVHRVR